MVNGKIKTKMNESKNSFIQEVNDLKQSNIDTYKQTKRITADFRLEKATTKSYNDRQILELLQNCDDAISNECKNEECTVFIKLDTANNILRISNYGEPFTIDGIGSLLIANTSSKGREFIGNKGLGFRSVLNWVTAINIFTQNCKISFSQQLAQKAFKELVVSVDAQNELTQINKEHLDKDEVPLAVLSMPKVEEHKPDDSFATTVELHYQKSKESDIIEQLKRLNTKLLLFLNHIKHIEIHYENENIKEEIFIDESLSEPGKVVTNKGTWFTKDSGDIYFDSIENNDRYYRIKLAWQNDLSDIHSNFYTYFPTSVPTHLPLLIHATFDLDPTRNYLNKSNNAENQTILKKVAELMKDTALNEISSQGCNWNAYKFLLPTEQNSNDLLKEFYSKLTDYRNSEKIYPCVNDHFLFKNEVYYHGDELSTWVLDNNLGKFFPHLLLPKAELSLNINQRYSREEWADILTNIHSLLTIETRVQLIDILISDGILGFFENIHKSSIKLPLLLDNNENLVDALKQVFTKDTEDINYELPDFITDIAFIHPELYREIKKQLINKIRIEQRENESGPSRAIKRLLSKIVNIGSDDITDVIQHIVSHTNKELRQNDNRKGVITQMVASLYSIYISNTERRGNLTTVKNIPLISREGNVKNADELFLGKEYDNGYKTELIFEGINNDNDYLAGNEFWHLITDDEKRLSGFFQWLNVNTISRYAVIEKNLNRWDNDDYTSFMLEKTHWHRRDVYKSYKVGSIVNFEKILIHDSFSIEKLIAWVALDDKLKQKLKLINDDVFTFQFDKDLKTLSEKSSYLSYLISKSKITENVLGTIPIQGLTNLRSIDLKNPLFKQLNLKQFEIEEVLFLLNINNSFNNLLPNIVYQLLNDYSQTEGINSQQVYKQFYEYFRENEETQLRDFSPEIAPLNYFARKGGIGSIITLPDINDDIYYSDNKLLPQKILDNYWFINLPKRIGENRVKTFFGVKLIKDIIRGIDIQAIGLHKQNDELNSYFDKIKPHLLCYRLHELKTQSLSRENEASLIKAFKIKLVLDAIVRFGDVKSGDHLDNYEFIPDGTQFVLKCPQEHEFKNLQQNQLFCDAIAEMLCITFKTKELKNTFRRIFKDGIIESAHLIKVDEMENLFSEAQKLLGVSESQTNFWNIVLPIANQISSDITNNKEFKRIIEVHLSEKLPEYYSNVDFSDFNNLVGVDFLSWIMNRLSFDLKNVLPEHGLISWHKARLQDEIRNNAHEFENKLWYQADISENIELKEKYLEKAFAFDDLINKGEFKTFIENEKYSLKPDYKAEIINHVKNIYNIELNSDFNNELKIENLYSDLLKNYRFGNSLNDIENILKEENSNIYSLLFFKGFESSIKTVLDKLENENNTSYETDNSEEKSGTPLTIIESSLSKVIPGKSNYNGSGGSYSHNSKHERGKAKAGKREENKVVSALIADNYEVRHVAQKSDTKHYDIEYKKKGDIQWRLLEVKKDSGGYFYLSSSEKDTAINKENKEIYDVAIVNGDKIHIIKRLFDFEYETFENNSRFYAEPTEFKVQFKIEN